MLRADVKNDIEKQFGVFTAPPETLHGGDINEVYLVQTKAGPLVIKWNPTPLPGMFPAEAEGLDALRRAEAFRIPEVFHACETYLALEYIPQGAQVSIEGAAYGNSLARLHSTTSEHYGWQHHNYIGSLPQQNTRHKSGVEFYREERLLPQFRMARECGFKFQQLDAFLRGLETLIPEEPASLIHGDLWSGNYMVSSKGEPCLIDPAVSFASREMDLAMMALFGGFPKHYTNAYNEVYPLSPEWKERIPLWQLYYVLVHLNLFGAGYYPRCVQIMKGYL